MRTSIKYFGGVLLALPFLPYLSAQGRKIRAAVPVLPEANGASGTAGENGAHPFHMLTIGESAMAGVGMDLHENAFTGELARVLARELGTAVTWQVHARRGLTARRVLEEIVPGIPRKNADLVVIQLGVNDAFGLHSPLRWKRDVRALVEALREKTGPAPIAFVNMPPVGEFPAFPRSIRFILGRLLHLLCDELANLAEQDDSIYYNRQRLTLDGWISRLAVDVGPEELFSDGVHPSALTYRMWARDFASYLLQAIGKEQLIRTSVY
jgi:lysophospholipase L1-like esterase